MQLNAYLEIADNDTGGPVVRCLQCQQSLGPASVPYKELCATSRKPLPEYGLPGPPAGSAESEYELRETYCPHCFVLIDTDVALRTDPVLNDVELGSRASGEG